MTLNRSDFPNDFMFGVATSSYQIEGTKFGGCGASHWDTFAATPGNVTRGENGTIACDHYNRWEEDLDLVQQAGFGSYRFSTSWARIEPDEGAINAQGLDFYDRLIDGMLERDIAPIATLYHWDLPAWMAVRGGWQNRDIAAKFGDYTSVIMQKIGDRVAKVAPINEPWCVAWLSHFLGEHAPGLRDIKAAAHALHHVSLAHGTSIQTMRSMGIENLGLITNHEYVKPADESEKTRAAAQLYDGIYNRWFLDAVFKKQYPADVIDKLEPYMPKNYQDDFSVIGQPVDWHGINYYTRKIISSIDSDLFGAYKEVEGPLEKTLMDWEVYPEGLDYFLSWTHENYTKGLPIYITENGMAGADEIIDGRVEDQARIDFLNRHLDKALHAITQGIPLKGYIVWSLLDNFEWALGYDKRFGLVHIDFNTLERTPKASFEAIKSLLASDKK